MKSQCYLLYVTNSEHKNITKENLGALWKTQLSLTLQLGYLYPTATFFITHVTESKLILLATQQADKSRDKVMEQGLATLFRNPTDREDGGLVSQRTTLLVLEFRLLLYWLASYCKHF